jgi:hypothetical protein
MSPEKDEILCKKYPLIFKHRNGPIMDTCMAWGVDCEDGWFDLLDTLCGEIQRHVDWKSKDLSQEEKESLQVVASQVKEKFGTLRFYYYGGDDTTDGMIDMAEALSAKICEDCGVPGQLRTNGWHRTVCDSCEGKRKNF